MTADVIPFSRAQERAAAAERAETTRFHALTQILNVSDLPAALGTSTEWVRSMMSVLRFYTAAEPGPMVSVPLTPLLLAIIRLEEIEHDGPPCEGAPLSPPMEKS